MSKQTATLKVWQVTESEWFAAATAEDAVKAYQEYAKGCYGDGTLAYQEQEELRREFGEPGLSDMDRLKFTDEDGTVRTFREELDRRIADGDDFPAFFATSEF